MLTAVERRSSSQLWVQRCALCLVRLELGGSQQITRSARLCAVSAASSFQDFSLPTQSTVIAMCKTSKVDPELETFIVFWLMAAFCAQVTLHARQVGRVAAKATLTQREPAHRKVPL